MITPPLCECGRLSVNLVSEKCFRCEDKEPESEVYARELFRQQFCEDYTDLADDAYAVEQDK